VSKVFNLWLLLSFIPALSFAGPSSSGGGPGVICTDPTGKTIQSAELLDLFQGPWSQPILGIVKSDASVDDQLKAIEAKLQILSPHLASDFIAEVSSLQSNKFMIPPGFEITLGTDLGVDYPVVIPEGCKVEYAGFYDSTGRLNISTDVFTKFGNTDQAAFWAHEALYKLARDFYDASTSEDTRVLNAVLFSTTVFPNWQDSNFKLAEGLSWSKFEWPLSSLAFPTVWVAPEMQVNGSNEPITAAFEGPVNLTGSTTDFTITFTNPNKAQLSETSECYTRDGLYVSGNYDPGANSDSTHVVTLPAHKDGHECDLVVVSIFPEGVTDADLQNALQGARAEVKYGSQVIGSFTTELIVPMPGPFRRPRWAIPVYR